MKAVCLLGYHCNGFVATHALGHNLYTVCPSVWVAMMPRSHMVITTRIHSFCDFIYRYIYIYIYIFYIYMKSYVLFIYIKSFELFVNRT